MTAWNKDTRITVQIKITVPIGEIREIPVMTITGTTVIATTTDITPGAGIREMIAEGMTGIGVTGTEGCLISGSGFDIYYFFKPEKDLRFIFK